MSSAPPIAVDPGTSTYKDALRRIFSFPIMLCSMLVALGTLTVRSRFNDPDMWWHLKTGEVIWKKHVIPKVDIFSYTTNHRALIPHEWLSQLLIYSAFHWKGYSALMLWLCLLTALLLVSSYILCSLYSGNPKTALLGALTVWFFSTVGLAVRPQVVGYLFLVFELLLLHLGRTRHRRWFYCLPLLFALWVNCHASFALGIGIVVIVLLSSLFRFRVGLLLASHWEPKQRKTLTVALLLSTAALFLNPDGINQVLYPLRAMVSLPLNLSLIEEWRPLQMSGARAIALLAVLVCILLIPLLRISALYWHEVLLLTSGTVLAISHERMIFVFGILAGPVISRLVAPLWDNYDVHHDHPYANGLLIASAVAVTVLAFPNSNNIAKQIGAGSPVKALVFMRDHHLSGNMLNAYGFGGYLIWSAPEYPVFVDGRGDLFESAGILGEMNQWALLKSPPAELLNKWDVSFCLLERHAPIVQGMLLLPGWKEVYADDLSIIFVRSTPAPRHSLTH